MMTRSNGKVLVGLAAVAMVGWTSVAAFGDTVFVESTTGGQNKAWYSEPLAFTGDSGAKSSATGCTAGIKSRYSSSDGSNGRAFKVAPTLAVAGGTYDVYVTHTASSCSTDIIASITQVNCSGLPATTDGFQASKGANSWYKVGTLTLDPGQTQPQITFTRSGGASLSGSLRFYADAVKFDLAGQPCQSTPDVFVNGPIAAGQGTVNVRGVAASATAVSVYASGALIGEKTSGIVGGVETVTLTTSLTKGTHLQATQTVAGQPGCAPPASTGPLVGGGRTPTVGISYSIRQNKTLVDGVIGTPTPTLPAGDTFWLPATGQTGFAAAVLGTRVITPSKCWQTVSAQRDVDSAFRWNTAPGNVPLEGNFGHLEGFQISLQEADTGPYRIYVDQLMNGSTVIQTFESVSLGANCMIAQPSYSSSSEAFMLYNEGIPHAANPDLNASVVSNDYADIGSRSDRISWQFATTASSASMRLLNATVTGGTVYPVVDLRLPITLRILVLPVGEVPGARPTVDSIQVVPATAKTPVGGMLKFSVNATGVAPFHYQWLKNGVPVGTDSNTYDFMDAQVSDNGAHVSVSVCDANASTHSEDVVVSISPCGLPWADTDEDKDVDMDDFGAFQACFDPNTSVPAPGCGCFDVFPPSAPDGRIDSGDFTEFARCQTGAGVVFDAAEHPDCHP